MQIRIGNCIRIGVRELELVVKLLASQITFSFFPLCLHPVRMHVLILTVNLTAKSFVYIVTATVAYSLDAVAGP